MLDLKPVLIVVLSLTTYSCIGPSRYPAFNHISGSTSAQPVLHTNQHYLESVLSTVHDIDLQDPLSVFDFVLGKLGSKVIVYPSESYYYFSFYVNGEEVQGNINLNRAFRDDGKIALGYFTTHTRMMAENSGLYNGKIFSAKDGVLVRALSPWLYEVRYAGRSVLFELKQLDQTRPPIVGKRLNETSIGRLFDESGFRFYLVYRNTDSGFMFELDESVNLPDTLINVKDEIFIANRSEFVFFADEGNQRKVLIGVRKRNVTENNFYDGPFDQLPDNYIEGDLFKTYLEASYPLVKGQIDRLGWFIDNNGKKRGDRIAVRPYLVYSTLAEMFDHVDNCQLKDKANFLACLTLDSRSK